MKKISIIAMLFACSMTLFTACDDDRDSNPTLQEPTKFELNTPALAGEVIDLASTSSLNFTCSQPDFGYTAAATYKVQVSLTDSYTKLPEECEDGETPDYAELDDAFTSCQISANPSQFAKAVQQVSRTPEDQIPASQEVYVRLKSTVGNKSIVSNSVKIKVSPYYVELKDAAPLMWYLTGAIIGDGKWNNSVTGVGVSLIPMFTQKDCDYDKKTGAGILEYTDWFDAGDFKIIFTPGNWDYGFCGGSWNGDNYTCELRNGGDDPGNINLGEAGYYTITIDTKAVTCVITKADVKQPVVYAAMGLPGGYNGWDQTAAADMTPIKSYDGAKENHIWTSDVTFDADGEVKFHNGDDWFGGRNFPYGYASTAVGDNLPVKSGSYKVFFNDLTGAYYFFEK